MKYDSDWCRAEALRLLDFHARAVNPKGGFYKLARNGAPLPDTTRELHETTRMVDAYAKGAALGHKDAARIVDHGVRYLLDAHFDPRHGGFWWSVDDNGPQERAKIAYGHAFVLLAAASARQAGHPDADLLRARAMEALDRFWQDPPGAASDWASEDWATQTDYRGGNANMHLTEAHLAAWQAWGDAADLDRACQIIELLINRHARAEGWVVPEHFDANWQIDRECDGDAMFRPSGTTPGHAVEWARFLLQAEAAGRDPQGWMLPAARALFDRAWGEAWLPEGGLAYTMGWDGQISRRWRFWWPNAEAVATANALATRSGDGRYTEIAARIWAHLDRHHIDHAHGGWFPEIDAAGQPTESIFPGKPDIYHALTATLSGITKPA